MNSLVEEMTLPVVMQDVDEDGEQEGEELEDLEGKDDEEEEFPQDTESEM